MYRRFLVVLALTVVVLAGALGARADDAVAVVAAVNRERAQAGLAPLSWEGHLQAAAEAHAADMAGRDQLTHAGGDGASVADRVTRAGYRYRRVAENIAAGEENPAAVAGMWMASSGHRANILNPDLRHAAAARAAGRPEGRFEVYWVLVLAAPFGGD